MDKQFTFKVDFKTRNSLCMAEVNQDDNAVFNIYLTDQGKAMNISNLDVRLFARKPDGKMVCQESGIERVDVANGLIKITVQNSMFEAVGVVTCQLDLWQEKTIISSGAFLFEVHEHLANNEFVESHVDVNLFKHLTEYMDEAISEMNKYKALVESFVKAGVSLEGLIDIKAYIDNNLQGLKDESAKAEGLIPQVNQTSQNAEAKNQELSGTIVSAENKKNELQSVINSFEAEGVLTIVSPPASRDCNDFKTINTYFTFDTGLGDFNHTPEGYLGANTSKVFIVTNRGFSDGRFQQEFTYLYPQDTITTWVRNYNSDKGGQWGTWWKKYDSLNKPTPAEIGALSHSGDTMTGTLTFNVQGNEIEIHNPVQGTQSRGVVYRGENNALAGMIGGLYLNENLQNVFMGTTASPWDGRNSLVVTSEGAKFNNRKVLLEGDSISSNGGDVSGDINFTPDNTGINFYGGGKFYKKNGSGLTIVPHEDEIGINIRYKDEVKSMMEISSAYLQYKGQDIYWKGNPPKASEVGALGKDEKASDSTRLEGLGLFSKQVGQDGVAYVGSDGVMEVGQYIDFHLPNNDSDYSPRLASYGDGLTINEHPIYHEGHKPTPDEIGALGEKGEIGATTDFNTLMEAGMYKVQAIAPNTPNNPLILDNGIYPYGILVIYKTAVPQEERTLQVYYPHQPGSVGHKTPIARMFNAGGWTDWYFIAGTVEKKNLLVLNNHPESAVMSPTSSFAHADIRTLPDIGGGDYSMAGNIVFSSENGSVNMIVDGDFYGKEGQIPVIQNIQSNRNDINTHTQQIASNSSAIQDLYSWANRDIAMRYISGATSLTLYPNCSYYLDGSHVADITHIDHSNIPAGGRVYFFVASGDPNAHIVFRRSGLCNQDVRVWLPRGEDFWITGNSNGDTIYTLMKIGDSMRFLG